jgi:hypothetical protein
MAASLPNVPAAKFGFNSFEEIKSHSSILFNERLAILFYLLDVRSIELNTHYEIDKILEVRSLIKQIYKNIRCLLSYNPTVRATLNLETKDDGVYVTDVGIGLIDKMIEYCEVNEYTPKRIYILVQELNNVEMMLKQVLQYFHYFIRPAFRQKPDVEIAVEKYKEIADEQTVEELRNIVGKSNLTDFANLSSSRIDIKSEVEYDEDVDGEDEEEGLLLEEDNDYEEDDDNNDEG